MGCYSSYMTDDDKASASNIKTCIRKMHTAKHFFYENLHSFSLFSNKRIDLAVKILLTNLRIQKCDFDCSEESPFIFMERPTFELSLFYAYLQNIEHCLSEIKQLTKNKQKYPTKLQAKCERTFNRMQREFKAIKKFIKTTIKKEL